VLDSLNHIEKKVTGSDERWFKFRVMSYLTHEDLNYGLVITFIDITKSKQVKEEFENTQK
jgi:two-component system CheB/CheR fusion protein